jgi:DGQHR domain-containing protein
VNTITLQALEVRQNGSRLLLTKMRAADVIAYTELEHYDGTLGFDDPNQGYQRPAEEPRIRKFANWLVHEKENGGRVRMPTAILLSARGSDVTLGSNGTVTLKSSNKLPLIDGQHRTRGFQYAIERKGLSEFADYEIPVVILMELDKIGEMKQFRTVNGEQKSVRTDLVNMILTQLVEHEGEEAVGDAHQWKVIAAHVVRKLNEDKDGPWFDRIVMPDQHSHSKEEIELDPGLAHRRTSRATSFITSLKPLIQYMDHIRAGHKTVYERADELFAVVDGYWRAIRDLNPACFDKAADYVMLKTPGIFSLHRLALSIMKDMYVGRRAFTRKEFKHMLSESQFIADPQTWAVGENEFTRGDAAKYGGMKGYADLGDLMYAGLRP